MMKILLCFLLGHDLSDPKKYWSEPDDMGREWYLYVSKCSRCKARLAHSGN